MEDRARIRAALEHLYARREANDAKGIMEVLAPDATYRVAGHPEHCAAIATHGGAQLEAAMGDLCRIFPAGKFEVVSMLVDGDRAAVMLKIALTFAPTDEPVSSELAHFWTFRDGKVVEIVEFMDTAHVTNLFTAAETLRLAG
jgi:ketosteroid isomerase-like protein